MKFRLRNTSFVYPDGTGDIWAEHLCLDFAGNDPESYALFVEQVLGKI